MKKMFKSFLSVFTIFLAILLIATASIVKAAPAPENQTVEGEGNHFVTGESFPSSINVVGYDVTNNKYYLNFTLTTTKTTPATVEYYIDVFNEAGTKLETDGDYSATTTAAMSGQTLDIKNKVVSLTGPLTAKYSLIITVKKVT